MHQKERDLRERFLSIHVEELYARLTARRSKFLRMEAQGGCYEVSRAGRGRYQLGTNQNVVNSYPTQVTASSIPFLSVACRGIVAPSAG